MSRIIEAAKAELEEIAMDMRKLQARKLYAEKIIAGYPREMSADTAPSIKKQPMSKENSEETNASDNKVITPVSEVRNMARKALSGKNLSGDELYDVIVAQGAIIGGKSPKGNLSAKLASAKDIEYSRHTKTWRLVKDTEGVTAPSVSSDAQNASFSNSLQKQA